MWRSPGLDQLCLGSTYPVNDRAFGVTGVARRQACGKTLKRAAKLVKPAHIVPVEPPHPQPVIVALQNALGPQRRQRLAKRSTADRQCGDKLGFLEPRAGSQLSGLNGVKDQPPQPDRRGCLRDIVTIL